MGVVGHGGGIARPIEVVNTVLEVADVAWKAMEIRHKHQHHHSEEEHESSKVEEEEEEISSLRTENLRLRGVLEENLKLLQQLSDSPPLQKDCPPDLYKRLAAAVDSAAFLTQLESLHQASFNAPTNDFPFREAKGDDLHIVETLVNVGLKEPSWWVWVTSENALDNGEELSGIDNEGYVIVNEDQVVDSVSNFIAKCILSNPRAKNITPEELRKTVAKALTSMNKIEKVFSIWHAATLFYTLSTWGLALAGLYRHRAVVKVAAKGITTSGKFLMKLDKYQEQGELLELMLIVRSKTIELGCDSNEILHIIQPLCIIIYSLVTVCGYKAVIKFFPHQVSDLEIAVSHLEKCHLTPAGTSLRQESNGEMEVRDELENLLDDDMDMAEMYLTHKLAFQQSEEIASKDN